ncbi:MAG: hypothetical protein ACPGVG_15910 [Mycobacterium sp.]
MRFVERISGLPPIGDQQRVHTFGAVGGPCAASGDRRRSSLSFVRFPVVLVVVLAVTGYEAFKEIGPLLMQGWVVVDGVGEIENIIANAAEFPVTSTPRELPQDQLQRFTVGQHTFSNLIAVEFLGHHFGADLHESGRSARHFDDTNWRRPLRGGCAFSVR